MRIFDRFKKGEALAKAVTQKNFDRLFDIIENLDFEGPVKLIRNGWKWTIKVLKPVADGKSLEAKDDGKTPYSESIAVPKFSLKNFETAPVQSTMTKDLIGNYKFPVKYGDSLVYVQFDGTIFGGNSIKYVESYFVNSSKHSCKESEAAYIEIDIAFTDETMPMVKVYVPISRIVQVIDKGASGDYENFEMVTRTGVTRTAFPFKLRNGKDGALYGQSGVDNTLTLYTPLNGTGISLDRGSLEFTLENGDTANPSYRLEGNVYCQWGKDFRAQLKQLGDQLKSLEDRISALSSQENQNAKDIKDIKNQQNISTNNYKSLEERVAHLESLHTK